MSRQMNGTKSQKRVLEMIVHVNSAPRG